MLNQSKLNIGRHICLFIYAYDLIEVLTFAWCKNNERIPLRCTFAYFLFWLQNSL